MESKEIKVLVVEYRRAPYTKVIVDSVPAIQAEVGGWFEAVSPFDDPVSILCDEDGKMKGLPLNRSLKDEDGNIYDILVGRFLLVGLGEGTYISLSDQLIEKYTELFGAGEFFCRVDNETYGIRWRPDGTPCKSFIQALADDEVPVEAADAYLQCWRKLENKPAPYVFLGLTKEEYLQWRWLGGKPTAESNALLKAFAKSRMR